MRGTIVAVLLLAASASYAGNTKLYYRGTMIGEDGKSVSGVFPMTFSLYKTKKAKHAIWSEPLWVAVDEGGYIVKLGERNRLPSGRLDKYIIGISVRGMGEVLREPFHPTVVSQTAGNGVKLPDVPSGAVEKRKNSGSASYADTAGFATEAGHAKSADAVGGLTLDQIMEKLGKAQEGSGSGKIVIGSARKYGSRVGGNGGTDEYNEQCPDGYVMIGLRGAYGLYLDSAQIVCAPIRLK